VYSKRNFCNATLLLLILQQTFASAANGLMSGNQHQVQA
jgi:hypothetical protein